MKRPIPLARAGQNGAPQGCAERIEDSHAQDADLFEPRVVSEGRVRRRLGRAILDGVSSSPGSPFLWVLSFGDAKALLHKSINGQATPIPRRTQPMRIVCGVPSAVKRFRIAAQI